MDKSVEGVVESLLNKMDTALSTKTVVEQFHSMEFSKKRKIM